MAQGKEMGFVAACKEFFGLLPGQTLLTFRQEMVALTSKDREEIRAGLEQNGYILKPE